MKGFPQLDIFAQVQRGDQENRRKSHRRQQDRIFELEAQFAEAGLDVFQGVVQALFAFLDIFIFFIQFFNTHPEQNEADLDVDNKEYLHKYMLKLEQFISETEQYFMNIKNDRDGRTIQDDLTDFKNNYNFDFEKYMGNSTPKSRLFDEMYKSSPKMLAVVFLVWA